MLRIAQVERLRIRPAAEFAFDQSAVQLSRVFADLAREVPRAEWDKLPENLTENLDYWLYGTPRR